MNEVPSSLPIGAFVLGAVLLLMALASGSVKIFGAEVTSAAGKLASTLAFILAFVFIGAGALMSRGPTVIPIRTPPPPPNPRERCTPYPACEVTTPIPKTK